MHAEDRDATRNRPPNRLAGELSPYLLQHAHNPVDWYPWGEEAFARARAEDKPIFLSVGYSTCHWCHVMERECFTWDDVAALLNAHFVPVKVDREERPDVDELYMHATQLIAGAGGWPNSVWLTPERKPWYAGTYFPREDHAHGLGFISVLRTLADVWIRRRAELEEYAARVWDTLTNVLPGTREGALPSAELPRRALLEGAAAFDGAHGGFGGAPKFPPHASLRLLAEELRRRRDETFLAIFTRTLDAMAAGGIYDHVAGGFHRYAVDAEWIVPHFEKMLYDNAQLVRAYVDGFLLTGNESYRRVALETCQWVLDEMCAPEGGFFSALDADSEGREGTYYVWCAEEIDTLLGAEEAALLRRAFGVTPQGNFHEHGIPEGRGLNVLHRVVSDAELAAQSAGGQVAQRLATSLRTLRAARAARQRPGLDDKIITAWNGLMLGSMAYAGAHLAEPRLIAAAQKAAAFVLSRMRTDGALLHTFRAGRAHIDAFLDDYACVTDGLLDLCEATGSADHLAAARELADALRQRFWDEARGGFENVAHAAPDRLMPFKTPFDGATPPGNAVAARALVRLAALTGEARYAALAEKTFRAFAESMDKYPGGVQTLIAAFARYLELAPQGAAAAGPGATPSAREPHFSAVALPLTLAPGGTGEVVLRLAIEEGWHLNSHAPAEHGLAPTRVAIEPAPGLAFGEPVYPDGTQARFELAPEPLSVYTGTIEVRVPVAAAADIAEGTRELAATIFAQACNDRSCSAPAAVNVTVRLEVRR